MKLLQIEVDKSLLDPATFRSAQLQNKANPYAELGIAPAGTIRKKYSYQEAENPEEFFVPCIWTSAVSSIFVVFISVHNCFILIYSCFPGSALPGNSMAITKCYSN